MCTKKEHYDVLFLPKLIDVVKNNHLAPKAINDELSKKIFDSFIANLDPEKEIFTLKEINQLRVEETLIDEALISGDSHFFDEAILIFKNGIKRVNNYSNHILNSKIDILSNEYYESNIDKIEFVEDEKYLNKRWELIIKKRFIEELYIIEITEQNLTFTKQKEIALRKTKAFFEDYFYQLLNRTDEQLLELYINSYLSNNDYQSDFLFPTSKLEWDEKFNRSFVGVGLSLEATLDYPKISSVIFEGPAWKTKKIYSGDILMKVATHENEFVNVAGFPLIKVIDLLKGKEGSFVKIIIKNSENKIEEIEIERGQVSLPKTMLYILKEETNNKQIGYISLPRFYGGEEGCASDLLKEIEYLNKNSIDRMILDLRDNQGGSARQAIKIMGYFLNGGVVMQAKYADGNHRIFKDENDTSQYSGKLIVLVNERSSSASELFAGTMQDYKRAIVVGNQTYGKGTIQRFFDVMNKDETKKVGETKLTIGSFYTGLGRSTQYNGVIPDIILPNENMYLETGERNIKNSLKFKNLDSKEVYTNISYEKSLSKLLLLSKTRQSKNDYFIELNNEAILKENSQSQSLISLNYKTYKSERNKLRSEKLNLSTIRNFTDTDFLSDENGSEKLEYWKSKLINDIYLHETLLIMSDY